MRFFFFAACYGVLILHCSGAGFFLTDTGHPMRWGTGVVRYVFDPGSLGNLTPSQAREMVKDAFQAWGDVDTATIRFQPDGFFNSDVTEHNFRGYFDTIAASRIDGILFDNDGAIVETLLGQQSSQSILGLTQTNATANGQIQYVWIIFNGLFLNKSAFNAETYLSTVTHELGHSIGLDHSQLFRHLALNGYGPDDQYIPVLYPVSTDDESKRALLTADDRASISMAYPDSSFSTQYGEIQGNVLSEGDLAFPGVNVVARKVDDPLSVAVTCVSGYLGGGDGAYRLAGLPAGDYLLSVEPIDPRFYGASQVGPYADTASGLSFTHVPFAEFYNGERETYDESSDPRSEATPVRVAPGLVIRNINFRVNSNPEPDDERKIQVLASGYPETGAVKGRQGYLVIDDYQYLFVVSQADDFMRIEVDTDPQAQLRIYLRHEAHVDFDHYDTFTEGSGHIELRRDRYNNPPLENGRYFIGIVNTLEPTSPYTLTVRSGRLAEGDLNGDGSINRLDLYYFANRWWDFVPDSGAREDLAPDNNKRVDKADLRRLLDLVGGATRRSLLRP